jgi:hypothetical protein
MSVNTVTVFLYIPCYHEKKNKLFRLTFLRRGVLSFGSPSPSVRVLRLRDRSWYVEDTTGVTSRKLSGIKSGSAETGSGLNRRDSSSKVESSSS